MEIISVTPRGYCLGVVRAIQIAKKTVEENPNTPITMLGMIVHNAYVVDACRNMGIRIIENSGKTRVELLDEVNEGIVIFTAHGVSDEVYRKAEKKGLTIVDATCPDVKKTHDLIRTHCQSGDVIYIGKHRHPESEGAVGISPRVHLIANEEDLSMLGDLHNVLITNQTTLSIIDTKALAEKCLEKYPSATLSPEICNATTIRQEAILKLKNIDVLIVVGDPHSNNTRQLSELGKKAGIPASYRIASYSELTDEMVQHAERVAVTSGSSTPTVLTDQVISCLKAYAESGTWIIPESSNDPVL